MRTNYDDEDDGGGDGENNGPENVGDDRGDGGDGARGWW